MITAGIAATRPKAVASSASAMPGATTARLVVCDFEMPIKLFMMPQTVPNSPEGRRCTDGGEQSHAEPDPPRFGAHDLAEARGRALLDPGVARDAGREARLAH